VGNEPLPGGNGGDAGETLLVPSLYYVHPLSQRFTFGLRVNVPLGLTTEYEDD
jgi:long-chain fatty acid transport protein